MTNLTIITKRPVHFRTATSLKTVHITVKEWFDDRAGNSYFSAQAVINDKYIVLLPFQYGYGDHGCYLTCAALFDMGLTDKNLYRWSERKSIESFSVDKIENCLKREVKAFGEGL